MECLRFLNCVARPGRTGNDLEQLGVVSAASPRVSTIYMIRLAIKNVYFAFSVSAGGIRSVE